MSVRGMKGGDLSADTIRMIAEGGAEFQRRMEALKAEQDAVSNMRAEHAEEVRAANEKRYGRESVIAAREAAFEDYTQKKHAEFEERESDLNERVRVVAESEAALDSRSQGLDERELDLEARGKAVAEAEARAKALREFLNQ